MKLNGKFEQAFLLASDLHRDQIRKGSTTPYLSHLIGVASIALRFGQPKTKPSRLYYMTPLKTRAENRY